LFPTAFRLADAGGEPAAFVAVGGGRAQRTNAAWANHVEAVAATYNTDRP
jgi:hypothetical protein